MQNSIGNLNANTIIQGLIAIVALGGTLILVLNHAEIPNVILVLDGAIITFYFNNMTTRSTVSAVIDKLNGEAK